MSDIINNLIEKSLEESGFTYRYLYKEYPEASRLVGKVGEAIGWDVEAARSFALHILEEVNDHEMMARLEKFFKQNSMV